MLNSSTSVAYKKRIYLKCATRCLGNIFVTLLRKLPSLSPPAQLKNGHLLIQTHRYNKCQAESDMAASITHSTYSILQPEKSHWTTYTCRYVLISLNSAHPLTVVGVPGISPSELLVLSSPGTCNNDLRLDLIGEPVPSDSIVPGGTR